MSGGQVVVDKNKAVWLRFGTNVLHFSAMCYWDGKLVCGVGESAGAGTYPCLIYLDKTSLTECGALGAAGNVLQTTYRTKMFGVENDCRKMLERITVVYHDLAAYAGSVLTVKYRIDGTLVNSLPSFTSLISITQTGDGKIKFKNQDVAVAGDGKFWDFQADCTTGLKVLAIIPHLKPLTKEQN